MRYERELEVALRAAAAGGDAALGWFRRGPEVRRKADHSVVTDADLASERSLFEIVRGEFPDDSFYGEESGERRGSTQRRWIADPIDGTIGFTRGLPFWSVLLALEEEGEVVAGVAHFPALGVTYSASRGGGCRKNGEPVVCRSDATMDDAIVQVAELRELLASDAAGRIGEIIGRTRLTRSIGDALAGCLVLEGACDLWIERGLKPYDVAPFYVMAGEAGATVSDWTGERSLTSGSIVLAPPALHADAIGMLAG
jgi:histidinol-phosphatase